LAAASHSQVKGIMKPHKAKKQGAAGITTAAPYIAGQWGRGE
jgi:hypothetical protein